MTGPATLCPTGRTLDEYAVERLVQSLNRCCFLLATTQLIIVDETARKTIREACAEARAAIAAVRPA